MSFTLTQIGGTEEYKICQGIKEGRITKPVVCWCIGTCATMFASEVSYLWKSWLWILLLLLPGRNFFPVICFTAIFRFSLAMQELVPTRLQRQRWPRTRL